MAARPRRRDGSLRPLPKSCYLESADWIKLHNKVNSVLDLHQVKAEVFTTRVDTIFGATSLQLAPQHPLVADFVAADAELGEKVRELLAEQQKAREVGDVQLDVRQLADADHGSPSRSPAARVRAR